MKTATRDRMLALTFAVWIVLQIALPVRYMLTEDTDHRFTWRMFSGAWRTCPVEIRGYSADRRVVTAVLTDPTDTGQRHLGALREALCEEFAGRGFVHATLVTGPDDAPAYVRELSLEPSLCPDLTPEEGP